MAKNIKMDKPTLRVNKGLLEDLKCNFRFNIYNHIKKQTAIQEVLDTLSEEILIARAKGFSWAAIARNINSMPKLIEGRTQGIHPSTISAYFEKRTLTEKEREAGGVTLEQPEPEPAPLPQEPAPLPENEPAPLLLPPQNDQH